MATDRQWLIVGRAAKPHGVHGDILVEVITDFPDRMQPGVEFGLGPAEGPETHHTVHAVRWHKDRWLLSMRDIRSRDLIEGWRGRFLFLPELDRDELPEGYYYEHDLTGLECVAPDGRPLGTITGFDPDDSQIRIVVHRDGRNFTVPWVPAIVQSVDLEAGTVVIDAPAGLLDDDAVEVKRN